MEKGIELGAGSAAQVPLTLSSEPLGPQMPAGVPTGTVWSGILAFHSARGHLTVGTGCSFLCSSERIMLVQ